MINQIKRTLSILVIVFMAQSAVMAETITGKLEMLNRSAGLIVIDGQKIKANMDETRISFEGESVGEENLERGDEVTLIFSDSTEPGQRTNLIHIILVNSSRSGLES